jgi:hypothetical protein
MTATQPKQRRSIAAAGTLFLLAPLVAEFLLGNLPITLLSALIVLAPLYGGGALLIRELVRRTGRGWPSILLLGIAYGILEEAFTTQSLFNPDYLGAHFHLLDPAWIPAFGIGAWWTFFVITLHAAWSICTSIAIAEALVPRRSNDPWLGSIGLSAVAALFAVGAVVITRMSYAKDHYLASHAQFLTAAILIVLFVAAAFLLPRARRISTSVLAPNPWLTGAFALAVASGVLLVPKDWGWLAASLVFVLDFAALALILLWSRSADWTPMHKLALGAGAALAYAWHSFVEVPVVGNQPGVVRVGNAIFTLGVLTIIVVAARRIASFRTEE